MGFFSGVVILLLVPFACFAEEFRPLYRGARAQAMGNAFTAVADDDQALFYNPAGLAGIQKFSFNISSVNAELSDTLIQEYPVYTNALSAFSLNSLNTFMGKNLSARAQGTVSLAIPGFEIAAIYDQQAALRLKNKAFPQGVIGSQTTYGVQVGFGTTALKLRRKKGELRVGAAGKVLWRAGRYQSPTLTQLMTLDSTSLTSNMSNYGIGFGLDLGTQFIYHLKKNLTLLAGVAWTDIGNTAFNNGGEAQKSNFTTGLAMKYKSADMTTTFSYDYAHMLDSADWKKKLHLGLELSFPIVSLYAGLNQLSFCYGAGLDVWLVKIMYVNYGEDQASVANIDTERRTMIHATVKFDL